jgi:hypothetical protein
MMIDKASADCILKRVCEVATPGWGGVEHRSCLQLSFTQIVRNRFMGNPY